MNKRAKRRERNVNRNEVRSKINVREWGQGKIQVRKMQERGKTTKEEGTT